VRAVLLASEEREIPRAAVDLAARIAERSNAPVHVFSIARVWGTSFGFPNPGLLPSKKDWDKQHQVVRKAGGAAAAEGHRGGRAGNRHASRGQAHRAGGQAARLRRDRDGGGPAEERADPRLQLVPGALPGEGAAGDIPVYLVLDESSVESAA